MTPNDDLTLFGSAAAARAAAADYESALNDFLVFGSARAVELLNLHPGETVLDVACGTGAATVLAAAAVAPGGHAVGVDLSPEMLEIAAGKARARGLHNIEWRIADMTRLDGPDGEYDAVLSVLGIFFAADMSAQAAELWRLARRGGRLAVTTLGQHWFAPLTDVFIAAAREFAPDVRQFYAPDRTAGPAVLAQVLAAGGVTEAAVRQETVRLPLRSPDDWWRIVMGTGLRRTVVEMGPEAAGRVRAHNQTWIVDHNIDAVDLSFIYALATKPLE